MGSSEFLPNSDVSVPGRARRAPDFREAPVRAIFSAMADHVDRYIPAETNGGWGVAAGVVLLALALIATVTYIHKQTYRHPTDVTWHGKGSGDAR